MPLRAWIHGTMIPSTIAKRTDVSQSIAVVLCAIRFQSTLTTIEAIRVTENTVKASTTNLRMLTSRCPWGSRDHLRKDSRNKLPHARRSFWIRPPSPAARARPRVQIKGHTSPTTSALSSRRIIHRNRATGCALGHTPTDCSTSFGAMPNLSAGSSGAPLRQSWWPWRAISSTEPSIPGQAFV